MAQEDVITGELRLSDRGFREDIELAMGNDVRRAIIELVTNADDSYIRLGAPGEIVIEVEHRRSKPRLIEVRDDAEGMTLEDINTRLAVQGGETSGFDAGNRVRGFFGRGGRDVVHFGPVSWTTLRNGEHHEFALEHDTTATRAYRITTLPPRSERRSGTIVRLEVRDRFTVPRHATLLEDLSRHYALRSILTDGNRSKIFLQDSGKQSSEELRYSSPHGLLVAEDEIEIDGYPGATARYSLYESPVSLNDDKDRTYWKHSLLITSQDAAYDIFPGGKFASEPYASYLARLFGTVDIPFLAELIREFDQRDSKGLRHDELNPTRLVRRDRGGLSREHPFIQQLYTAVESVLTPHINRLQEEAKAERTGRVSEENRRRFGDAGRILNEYLVEEELPTDGAGEGLSGAERVGLSIIPSSLVLEPGRAGAMTLRYQEEGLRDGERDAPTVHVQVTLQSGDSYRFTETLKERKGYFSKGIHIRGEEDGEIANIFARYRSRSAEGTVNWKQRDQPSIDMLQWNRKSYTLAQGKMRRALLYAPWDLVAYDDEWTLSVTPAEHVQILSQNLAFQYDYDLDAGVCVVELASDGLDEPGIINASTGGQSASAVLRFSVPRPGGLQIDLKTLDIPRRAWFEEDAGVLRLNAGHPANSRLLGKEEDGWPGQNSSAFQSMLAELLATTIVRHSMSRTEEYSRDSDINILFSTFDTKASTLADKLQRALIDQKELAAHTTPVR